MLITLDTFARIAGKKPNDNMASALQGLQYAGDTVGLNKPHRLAVFLAQTAHESAGWQWDKEIWGPTKAQKGYEGRKDLGNTQPGDGSLFRGYTPMQITGRYNTTKFYNWCKAKFPKLNPPNFVVKPYLMNTDPWEGIGPLWYWSEAKGFSLNGPCDRGDFRQATKLINGGYNGLSERYRYYGRAALVLLGRDVESMRDFQREYGLVADGIVGEKTFLLLHNLLLKLPAVKFTESAVVTGVNPFTALLNFIMKLIGK